MIIHCPLCRRLDDFFLFSFFLFFLAIENSSLRLLTLSVVSVWLVDSVAKNVSKIKWV